jgi:hypothetical protein
MSHMPTEFCLETQLDGDPDTYLCQVSETVSCGACCGLYNIPDLSRGNLVALLAQRTADFASAARTEGGIFEFQRKHSGPHRLTRPFPGFHHCPFLGFTGPGQSCVGCLLHPSVPGNLGKDYRSLSWYGELACRSYFCPATGKIPPDYQSILRLVIDDWYDFGLLVTEHALVNGYFKEVELRLGRTVTVEDFSRSADAGETLREFARLRADWPYRRAGTPGPCNYFFENGLYPRPEVTRTHAEIRKSPYELFFKELDSGFTSIRKLEAAERRLDELFSRTVRALIQPLQTQNIPD